MIRIFFDGLKDEEFERLCSDILKYKLNEEFICYKKGPDQGVDIESVIKGNNIIGQAKKYEETNFSKIKSDLEKIELPKVKLLNPSRYFLFISKELTRKQIGEIASIFLHI